VIGLDRNQWCRACQTVKAMTATQTISAIGIQFCIWMPRNQKSLTDHPSDMEAIKSLRLNSTTDTYYNMLATNEAASVGGLFANTTQLLLCRAPAIPGERSRWQSSAQQHAVVRSWG
jgi:hypothetical protein